jgi:hypothetical protein
MSFGPTADLSLHSGWVGTSFLTCVSGRCRAMRYVLQRSGVSRIGLMMSRVSMHEAVMEDALGPLLELAHSSDDADLVEQIVDILEALATAGGDGERQMMCVEGAEGVCCLFRVGGDEISGPQWLG